jgi:hypothetical protein
VEFALVGLAFFFFLNHPEKELIHRFKKQLFPDYKKQSSRESIISFQKSSLILLILLFLPKRYTLMELEYSALYFYSNECPAGGQDV